MMNSLISCSAILVSAVLGSSAQAQATIVNRTPHDMWIAVAFHRPSGQMFSTDDFHPGYLETRGWWKITAYGGSVKVPFAATPSYGTTFIYVDGAGGRKLKRFSSESRPLPVKRPDGFHFAWKYPDGPSDPWRSGALAGQARKKHMSLQQFAPLRQFGAGTTIELTKDSLGWRD